ncbi:hypothetical protein LAZ67_11003511 [Cordylochernes scorpioides]|uniref:Reverse transcriptase domain-containing protein n=1 Tax=Cordylochernes scorpioides TaxID=51811 RepID=A0ABY6L0N1_9ARAC|nr:hypothetical protein LAZ67_11003511 [Cordylochernes scorpioides]
MVETRSGKMQDPAQERIMPEESAKPQPGATIGRDASSDPVVLNPNIDIPKFDGTEDPRPLIVHVSRLKPYFERIDEAYNYHGKIGEEKAFDTVPHSILWKKLYNLGISYQFISTIRSYYEQATIAIRWKGSFTESIKINSGVLQGEPLSPLLFILFITDLIEIYNNSDLTSVNLPEFGDIHLFLYADDIAIIGESRMNLQKKIKILREYLDENLMTLNESKSKIMVFRNGGKPSNKDRWFWNDKPITITSRYTYLGFPLTPTITTTHPANYFKGKAINAHTPNINKIKSKVNKFINQTL